MTDHRPNGGRMSTKAPTWKDAMKMELLPVDFVQWAVQREGGLPDGPIQQKDYKRLAAEYLGVTESPDG